MFLNNLQIDTDYGRDIYEMSNIFLHKVVWLGPRLSPGLSASPFYYYIYYPSMWLSRGDIRGPIYLNIFLTLCAAAVFLYASSRAIKSRLLILLISLVIFTNPMWYRLAIHPGNGYSYALFLIAGIAATYFSKNLWISALLYGIASAMHPASIFAIPILIGAYLSQKYNLKKLALGVFSFLFAWLPIIVFEIITKGFLTRQFLNHPSTGLSTSFFHLENWHIIASQLGLGSAWFVILLSVFLLKDKVVNIWEKLTLGFGLIFFAITSTVPEHYLFGLSMTLMYIFVKWVLQKQYLGVGIFLAWIVLSIFNHESQVVATRPLYAIEQNVKQITSLDYLKDKKVAVVAVLPSGTSVPQADDYRGLLRFKGIDVVELGEHNLADIMIYVVEQQDFDYEHWSTWETEQFGTKKIIEVKEVDKVKIVVWERI